MDESYLINHLIQCVHCGTEDCVLDRFQQRYICEYCWEAEDYAVSLEENKIANKD